MGLVSWYVDWGVSRYYTLIHWGANEFVVKISTFLQKHQLNQLHALTSPLLHLELIPNATSFTLHSRKFSMKFSVKFSLPFYCGNIANWIQVKMQPSLTIAASTYFLHWNAFVIIGIGGEFTVCLKVCIGRTCLRAGIRNYRGE